MNEYSCRALGVLLECILRGHDCVPLTPLEASKWQLPYLCVYCHVAVLTGAKNLSACFWLKSNPPILPWFSLHSVWKKLMDSYEVPIMWQVWCLALGIRRGCSLPSRASWQTWVHPSLVPRKQEHGVIAPCFVQARLIFDPVGHCLQETHVGEHSEEAREWVSWLDRPGFEASFCQ